MRARRTDLRKHPRRRLDSSADGVWINGLGGRIREVNSLEKLAAVLAQD